VTFGILKCFDRFDASVNELSDSRNADSLDLLDLQRRIIPDTGTEAAR